MMINCSDFRNTADFLIYGKGNQDLVRENILQDTLHKVRFGFIGGTGLSKGESGGLEIRRDAWRIISANNDIVMRYFKKLYDYFFSKKTIEFIHNNQKYNLVSLTDINGESVYMTGEISLVK